MKTTFYFWWSFNPNTNLYMTGGKMNMQNVLEGINPSDLSGKTIDLLTQHVIMQATKKTDGN